jgi:hypothetical protein
MNRGGVNRVSYIGVESTSGTAVAANRFLPTLSFDLAPDRQTKKFRARGAKVNTSHVKHKEMSKGMAEGVLDYNSFPYLCDSLFNPATATQIGAITAYTREWTPGVRSADSTGKTFTVEIGDATACEDYAYTKAINLDIEAGEDEFTIKSGLIARAAVHNQSLAGSPTEVTERPVERNDVDVYIDDTYGGLGGTKFTECLNESISLGDKFKEFFVHNSAASEFHDIVEIAYEPTFKFSTVHNAQSRSLIAALSTNPYKWIRWVAIGASLGTHLSVEYFEKIQFDMCVKFDNPEPINDEDGPMGYTFNCTMMPDTAGLGSFMKITSVNARSAL